MSRTWSFSPRKHKLSISEPFSPTLRSPLPPQPRPSSAAPASPAAGHPDLLIVRRSSAAAPLPNHSPTHLQPLSGEPPAPSPLPNPWPPIDCQSSQPPIPRWSLAGRPAGRREPSPSCFWWVLASKPLQKRATSPTSSACCCSRRPQRRAAPSRPAAAGEVQLLSLLLVFLPKFPSFCC
jgi:hypothetical protein